LQNTPLHPLAEWGRLRFGGADVAAEKRLADLEQALAQVKLDAGENAALLAPLLDIPLPEARAPKLAPEELRRRQLAAVAAWILAGARVQPLVLAFEDLHWADPTTLDLMKALAERGATAPLFIVATTRPEFRAPWATRSHHSVVSLVPLDRGEIRAMVGAIAERHALSNEVMEGVTDRTGGVPLFVEEVTRLLLEGGAQTIPPTLQQSLAARLDRLGEAREVAQIGAVLGREFSCGLLSAVACVAAVSDVADRGALSKRGYSEAALQSALDKLAEADLLFVEGHAPMATYRFKHALIQDAAYESLLKSRRQTLHRRAAEALIAAPDPQPELVAHHFTGAGATDLAIEWWGKAGDAALRRSAFQEAIAHLGKAIEMADNAGDRVSPQIDRDSGETRPRLAETNEVKAEAARRERRARLRSAYGQAAMWAKGYVAEETRASFESLQAGRDNALAPTEENLSQVYLSCVASLFQGNLPTAVKTANEFLDFAARSGKPMHVAIGRRMLGIVLMNQGRLAAAQHSLELALAEYVPGRDERSRYEFGVDSGILSKAYLGLVTWGAGDPARGRERLDESVAEANASGHVPTMVMAQLVVTVRHMMRGDAQGGLASAGTILTLAREHNMAFHQLIGELGVTWAKCSLGGPGLNLQDYQQALDRYAASGVEGQLPLYLLLLARLEFQSGAFDRAIASIERGLTIAEKTTERSMEPSLRVLLVPTIAEGCVPPLLELRVEVMASVHYLPPRSSDSGY